MTSIIHKDGHRLSNNFWTFKVFYFNLKWLKNRWYISYSNIVKEFIIFYFVQNSLKLFWYNLFFLLLWFIAFLFELKCLTMNLKQRKWVFATSTDFLILIYLQPNVVDLRYFKLRILLDQIIWVWNIKYLHHQVIKI